MQVTHPAESSVVAKVCYKLPCFFSTTNQLTLAGGPVLIDNDIANSSLLLSVSTPKSVIALHYSDLDNLLKHMVFSDLAQRSMSNIAYSLAQLEHLWINSGPPFILATAERHLMKLLSGVKIVDRFSKGISISYFSS